MAGSFRQTLTAVMSSAIVSEFIALSALGRLKVNVATPSSTVKRIFL
jgi:hypothetical protein